MISDRSIQSIKDIPLTEIVGMYITLKRRGSNFIGLCPFHNEHTPSFIVSPVRNSYKCFGCGIGGDGISFVMELEGKSFKEAVDSISKLFGIPLGQSKSQYDNPERSVSVVKNRFIVPQPIDTIPELYFDRALFQNVHGNPLTAKICHLLGESVVRKTIEDYLISIDGCWITYPQKDYSGKYRTAKSIFYQENGHRAAGVMPKWFHRELIRKRLLPENFRLKQCFTGEHLLGKQKSKPIAIVESQSTMLFMAALGHLSEVKGIKQLKSFSNFIWLSTGGTDGIGWKNADVFKVLKGRDVILFPDAGFYDMWSDDADLIRENGINVVVSDLLEEKYRRGFVGRNDDLRDYFQLFEEELRNMCGSSKIEILPNEIQSIPVKTQTGKDFGYLTMATVWMKDGKIYDVLQNKDGDLVTHHEKLEELSQFFEKTFLPAKFCGEDCLINIVNH